MTNPTIGLLTRRGSAAELEADMVRVAPYTALTSPRPRAVGVNDAGAVCGADHHRSKLSDHEVDLIRELKAEGLTYAAIASKFEVSRSTVQSICLLRRRGHVAVDQRFITPSEPRFRAARASDFHRV